MGSSLYGVADNCSAAVSAATVAGAHPGGCPPTPRSFDGRRDRNAALLQRAGATVASVPVARSRKAPLTVRAKAFTSLRDEENGLKLSLLALSVSAEAFPEGLSKSSWSLWLSTSQVRPRPPRAPVCTPAKPAGTAAAPSRPTAATAPAVRRGSLSSTSMQAGVSATTTFAPSFACRSNSAWSVGQPRARNSLGKRSKMRSAYSRNVSGGNPMATIQWRWMQCVSGSKPLVAPEANWSNPT
mmetsp:Transcript_149103/g.415573  ORF Transcript_149103/g.415573 Transcript_149103/m.415573 type:complete len:241 (-) Transcript_149103:2-724(-)